jgi:hypothetical protein
MKTKKVSKKEAIERRENTARTKAVTYWQESFASLWPKITDPDLKLVTHELALKQNISANYKALDSICPGYDGN